MDVGLAPLPSGVLERLRFPPRQHLPEKIGTLTLFIHLPATFDDRWDRSVASIVVARPVP
jgi:hypothetical protein